MVKNDHDTVALLRARSLDWDAFIRGKDLTSIYKIYGHTRLWKYGLSLQGFSNAMEMYKTYLEGQHDPVWR